MLGHWLEVDKLLETRSPLVTGVAVGPRPVRGAPRVPQEQELDFRIRGVTDDPQDRIGVALDDAIRG